MKVLFFHRSNDFTGSTRALASIIETEYSNKKIQVITTDVVGGGFLSNLENVKIHEVYYPRINGKRIIFLSYFLSIIHTFYLSIKIGFRFDTFYINTITPYAAAIAGSLLGKRIIYHVHEKFIGNSLENKLIEYVFEKTKATRYFVSQYVLNQYKSFGESAMVKYNKLPKSFVNAVDFVPLELRIKKNVIMISSLTVSKGIINFIEIAKLLPDYNFTLILSSNADDIQSFFGNELPGNLFILQAQANIHPFLKKSDLLLNLSIPSLWIETFGLTIIEAMAYGLPAIVPNVGGPVEIVKDGYNGYCIDVTNVNLVKEKIKDSFAVGNYNRMANNALERVKLFI